MVHSCNPVLGRQEDCSLDQVGLVGLCFKTKTNLVMRSLSPIECHQYLEILCSRLRNTALMLLRNVLFYYSLEVKS